MGSEKFSQFVLKTSQKLYETFVSNSLLYGTIIPVNGCLAAGCNVPHQGQEDTHSAQSACLKPDLTSKGVTTMGLVRGGIAGLGAWMWGGGIIGTILVFLLIFWLLGALGMS